MTDDDNTPPDGGLPQPRRPEVPAFRELRDLEEPDADFEADAPEDSSRKPTIEQERPVDLYHRDRHLREELRSAPDWFRGDSPTQPAPDEDWYADAPEGGVPPLVPGRAWPDAPFRLDGEPAPGLPPGGVDPRGVPQAHSAGETSADVGDPAGLGDLGYLHGGGTAHLRAVPPPAAGPEEPGAYRQGADLPQGASYPHEPAAAPGSSSSQGAGYAGGPARPQGPVRPPGSGYPPSAGESARPGQGLPVPRSSGEESGGAGRSAYGGPGVPFSSSGELVVPGAGEPWQGGDTPGRERGLRRPDANPDANSDAGPDASPDDTAEQPRVAGGTPAHHARPGRVFGASGDGEERGGRGWRRRARPGDDAPTDGPPAADEDTSDGPEAGAGGPDVPGGGNGGGGSGGGGGDDDGEFGELPEDPNTPEPSGRRRLATALWPPRVSRAQLVVGVLLFALGAGLAIQVRSNTESDPLRGARESDLVRVLDELEQRTGKLDDEQRRLELSRDQLENSNNRAEEARQQTDQRAQVLGILAGTVKATGPGITLTITDPQNQVRPDMLLDTLQELRAAGAEAIQINQVRVVAGTYFNEPVLGQMQIDGQTVSQPYVFKVIGNPRDLEPALNIPGGVIRTLEKKQAQAVVVPSQQVVVDALRVPTAPDYARPAPDAGNGG